MTRQRDRTDERQVRVALAPQGTVLVAKLAEIQGCFSDKSGLTIGQIVTLRDDLSALRDQLRPRPARRQA